MILVLRIAGVGMRFWLRTVEVRAMEMENTMLKINRIIRLSVAKRKGYRTMTSIRSLEQTSLENFSWNKAAK